MFASARLRMALWYTLILAVIVAFFSLLVYATIVAQFQTIAAAFERNLWMQHHAPEPPLFRNPEAFRAHLELVRRTVVARLVVTDVAILLLGAFAGYFLAGKTMEPIKHALEEQKRFVADSAHELRTPLTSLRTTLEVALREKRLTARAARAALAESLEDVESLERLTEDLLTLARYEKGGMADMVPVDLSEVVGRALRPLAKVAERKGVTLESAVEPLVHRGDEPALERLVSTLVDNAIKYTPEGGRVTVTARRAGRFVVLTVSDTGVGIPKDEIPKVFDRFYRADTARTRDGSHSHGLGLSIAKRIAELHGGTIAIASEPGRGTTVTVRLPLAP